MNAPIRIAFVCTGNACRSQMAEAIMRQVGGARFQVVSAGSNPAGYIHPVAAETMAELGLDLSGHYSKSWNEIAKEPLDIVITLCDHAAAQTCPAWTGNPLVAHWSLPDPSFYPGSDEERQIEARRIAETLRRRAAGIAALPLETMTANQVKRELDRLADVW
jgi:arsenate reductase